MNMTASDIPVETDAEGYLVHPEDWNREIALRLAAAEEVELSTEHWQVLEFMRDYYEAHQIAADARFTIKFIAEEMGYGKQARNHLFRLFPYGYVQQACKIAGMKRPRGWSTG